MFKKKICAGICLLLSLCITTTACKEPVVPPSSDSSPESQQSSFDSSTEISSEEISSEEDSGSSVEESSSLEDSSLESSKDSSSVTVEESSSSDEISSEEVSSEEYSSADSSEEYSSEDSSEESSSEEESWEEPIVVNENGKILEMSYHKPVSNAGTIGVTLQNYSKTFDLGYGVEYGGDWYRVEDDYALLEQILIKGEKASDFDGIFMACMDQKDSLFLGSDADGGLNMQAGDSIVFPQGLTYCNSNGVAFTTLFTFTYTWNGSEYDVVAQKDSVTSLPDYVIAEDYKTVNKARMFGIAEPFLEKRENSDQFQVVGFDPAITLEYLQALNVKSLRLMIPSTIFSKYMMFGPDEFEVELDANIVSYFKGIIGDLRAHGVTNIILQCPIYPKPMGFSGGGQSPTVPSRNDDVYGDWCLLMEEQWRVLAEAFYEINYFEVGNESNQHSYLSQPNGAKFTEAEICEINTDWLYYASRGLRKGNAYAYCVTPGYTSLGTLTAQADSFDTGASLPETLEAIYKNIQSGNFPYGETKSTDIEDYFKVIGLHTYEYYEWAPFESNMQKVIDLVNRYDNGRKIVITEMGWPDANNQNNITTNIPQKVTQMYTIFNNLPQVETACYFRLYNCDYALNWGGSGEESFGLFYEPTSTSGFVAKPLATTLQELFGGTGNLNAYADLAVLERELGYKLF